MLTGFRAAADRFIFDVANVRTVVACLPPDALEACVLATGWTARQTLAHLAETQGWYARALLRVLSGEPLRTGEETADRNRAQLKLHASTQSEELLARYAAGRDLTIRTLRWFTSNPALADLDGTRLGTVVAAWTGHASAHALDFLEAAPDLLDDSFVLNWALVPQGEPTAPWLERRALLIGEAERRIAGRQDGVPGKE